MSNVPGSFNYVQIESVQFNNPVSESSLVGLAAPINGLLSIVLPVASVLHSMLTEVQFQNQLGNPSPATWILADGRNVSGSLYQTITGNSSIPDLRGIFLRGKNDGRADGNQNPDGDLPLGTYQADQFTSHTHSYGTGPFAFVGGTAPAVGFFDGGTPKASSSAGGNETRAKNVTVNIFIRIN